MGFAEGKARNFFLFSTLVSAIGLTAAVVSKLSNISILIITAVFLAHLLVLWMVQKRTGPGKALLTWMQKPEFIQVGFLLFTSVLSSGLGFLAWIFLFEPGSLVRDALIQLSPVIGWGVVVAAYLLAALGAVLNEGEVKRDGLLVGAILFSVVGHLFLFWLSAQIFSFTIDDAYITFRYSKNLAAGFGPTYNPGLPPVEGYTTFLWMLLMTLPHFIGVNVATFSKIAGVLLTCGALAMTSLLTYTLTRGFPPKARLFFGAFATYLLAMLPITAIHAVAGMETMLFIVLISLMVYMVTVGLLGGSRLLFWSPLVGLLIGLTRPEGNAVALLVLACGWLFSAPPVRKRLVWFSLGLYVLPGAAYFAWRYFYYDLILPLPFYMKVLHGAGLFGGATEVGTYLLYLLPSISVLLLAALLRLRKEYFAVLAPVLFLLVFYLFPVHAMGFNWRFIYPATPFISILVAIGGINIYDLLRGAIQSTKPWEVVVLAGLFLIGLGNLSGLDSMIRNQNFYADGISAYKTFGTVLSEYNNKHEMTLAIGDAGTVPYYSDWQVIDLFGLNSREVAFGSVDIFTLAFEQQPVDLILLSVGANPNRISDEHAGAQNLYEEALKRGMAHIGTFSFGRVNNIWVVGYPRTELAEYLQENMEFKEQP
jgi:arabinofuranosyltransferase